MRAKTRTGSILDAARQATEEALLDQHMVAVGEAVYADFLARLDPPPKSNTRLDRTMRTPAPWEKG